MGHIFISYSHKDSTYVHKLVDSLEKEGFNIWIDDRIHYGSEWPKVVTRNLDISDGVIVILSNNSYESDMVQNELARAREKKKPIFPLLLGGENWLIVQAKQFVNVTDGSLPKDDFYKRLENITSRKKRKVEAVERNIQENIDKEPAGKKKKQNGITKKVLREKVEHKLIGRPEQRSEKLGSRSTSGSQVVILITGVIAFLVIGYSIFTFVINGLSDRNEKLTPTFTLTPTLTSTVTSSLTSNATDNRILDPMPGYTATLDSTPTPTFAYVTLSTAANCREGASVDFPLLDTFDIGVTIEVVGKHPFDNYWYVRSPKNPSIYCWMWGFYATGGNLGNVPVMTPPPPSPQ